MYFDQNGEIAETKIHIIHGAPASGKTAYVKEHKGSGDLVVDVDAIRQALFLEDCHGDAGSLLNVILEIRETIYRMIERREIQCENIWIISLLPHYMEREELARRLGADLIYIDTDQDECLRRMEADPSRPDKEKQAEIIQDYFRELEI